jgi:hypothetical protein
VLVVAGLVGLCVNTVMLREARRARRWISRAGGVRAAGVAMGYIFRASLRIVGSLGVLLVGVLAAATPRRFAGQGVWFGVAIFAGVFSFSAIVAAWILDLRGRSDVRRLLVHELVAELRSGVEA